MKEWADRRCVALSRLKATGESNLGRATARFRLLGQAGAIQVVWKQSEWGSPLFGGHCRCRSDPNISSTSIPSFVNISTPITRPRHKQQLKMQPEIDTLLQVEDKSLSVGAKLHENAIVEVRRLGEARFSTAGLDGRIIIWEV